MSAPLLPGLVSRLVLATLPLSAAILRRGPPALLTLSKAVLRPLLAGIWPEPLPFGRTVGSVSAERAAADSSGSDPPLLLTSLPQLAVMLWPLLLYALLQRATSRVGLRASQDRRQPSSPSSGPQRRRRRAEVPCPLQQQQQSSDLINGAGASGGLRIVLLRVLRAAAVAHCLVAVAALSCGALVIEVPGCLLIHTAVQWHSLLLLQAVLVAAMALMRPNKDSTAPNLPTAVHLLLGTGSAWLALRLALTAATLAFAAVKPGWDILPEIMQLSPPAAVTGGDGPLGALLQPLLPPGYGPGADLRVAATGGILAVALHWVVLRAALAAALWGLLSTSGPKFQKIREGDMWTAAVAPLEIRRLRNLSMVVTLPVVLPSVSYPAAEGAAAEGAAAEGAAADAPVGPLRIGKPRFVMSAPAVSTPPEDPQRPQSRQGGDRGQQELQPLQPQLAGLVRASSVPVGERTLASVGPVRGGSEVRGRSSEREQQPDEAAGAGNGHSGRLRSTSAGTTDEAPGRTFLVVGFSDSSVEPAGEGQGEGAATATAGCHGAAGCTDRDNSSPVDAGASAAGTSAAAAPPLVLYTSRTQRVTVTYKLPAGVSYERAAEVLTAAAVPTVEAVMNGASPSGGGGGGPALAGAVSGGCRLPSGRWLSYMTEVLCLRGCLELVLRLQYMGGELDDAVLAEALAALKLELGEQLEGAAATTEPAAEEAAATAVAAAPGAPSAAAAAASAAAASRLLAPAGAAAAGGDAIDALHINPGASPFMAGGGGGVTDVFSRQRRGGLVTTSSATAPSAVASAAPGAAARLEIPAAVATPDDAGNYATSISGRSSSRGTTDAGVSGPVVQAVQLIALLDPPVVRLGGRRGGGEDGHEDGSEDGAVGRNGADAAGVSSTGGSFGADGTASGVVATSRQNGRGSLRTTARLHLYIGNYLHGGEAAAAAVDAGGGGSAACTDITAAGAAKSSPLQPLQAPPPSVDVRVVVKQHGSVIAEVERLTVGYPRGASVSLDLSGLREGDAVLVVLPCRQPPRQEEQSQASSPTPTLGGSVPRVAPLYLPIAVVPPAVAEELCGLMDKMEHAAAAAVGGSTEPTDPRVTRALASTHHFSALVSDMISLHLGCERLGAEGAESEVVQPGGASGDDAVVQVAAEDMDEIRQLCEDVLSFLSAMGLTATVRYVLQEIQATGGPALLCELLSDTTRELLSQLLRERPTGGEEEEEHPGPEEEEMEAQPRGAGADEEMAAEGSGHNRNGGRNEDQGESAAEGEDAGGGKGGIGSGGGVDGVVSGSEGPAGRLERFLRRGATPRHQRRLTALRAMLLGFSEPDMEEACTAFRCHHAQPWDLAVAVLNAVLAAVLVAFTIGAGYGGGEAVSWGPRGGGGFLSRIWPPLPPWALVQLALCCGCLLLPLLVLEVWDGLCKPRGRSPEERRQDRRRRPAERLREPLLRAGNAASLILLFAYVKWNGGPGEKMQLLRTGSALTALMVVTQPMWHSIHVRGSVGNWVVAAVMLALLFRAVADGDVATVASAGTAPSSLSNNWTAWLPSAVAAASLVLASVLLVAVRDVGWRMKFLEHGAPEAEEHGETARRRWRELKGGEEEGRRW
ncbi:hypothetical protein PLESTB_000862200 [Pleodorina starrii]|uniref:Uncharacterized protein n=1 Tax=Pleodorina starrii TaxID=330485 RepID=A0A9W6BLR9_9CHLO|nr:hypothetical protein PLESTB_000862200 [Pleodorina starrii]